MLATEDMIESELKQNWKNAVQLCLELPKYVRDSVECAVEIKRRSFDESYIEFLESQIKLSPRGPDWTERLKERKKALSPFCGCDLVGGRIQVGTVEYVVEVSGESSKVVYWEKYEKNN